MLDPLFFFFFFFFNDTATTEIYTLSLHDALPISLNQLSMPRLMNSSDDRYTISSGAMTSAPKMPTVRDRKSTRLNSSHSQISYAVFCLKKKKKQKTNTQHTTQETSNTHITSRCAS